MTAGSIIQLTAKGSIDAILTSNPQISFFKQVFRRTTNFSMECIEQDVTGISATCGRFKVSISKCGDLLSKLYVEAGLYPNLCDVSYTDTNSVALNIENSKAYNILKYVDLIIGGEVIDTLTFDWMSIHNNIRTPLEKKLQLSRLLNGQNEDGTIYIPLHFWFCEQISDALPILALQYNDIHLIFHLHDHASTIVDLQTIRVFGEYIFVENSERKRFTSCTKDYLITQVQTQGPIMYTDSDNLDINLRFSHPVKEIFWTVGDMTNPSAVKYETITHGSLEINGVRRCERRQGSYFTHYQMYRYYDGIPFSVAAYDSYTDAKISLRNNIHCYSFCLFPLKSQPSGSCNFSELDSAVLYLKLKPGPGTPRAVNIYAINYNVFRIENGVGFIVYAN
tara:strand:- start:10272 stop:11450 length:1179 start_codon:yes stop_codon:yes gene_type:complete